MAGMWEPAGGAFWSSPPEAPIDGVSVYWFIFSALVVAGVLVALVWRNAKKSEAETKPLKWSLRNHLGKVGSAITYTYLVVIVAMIWGRSGQLLTMPLNEVGDFLAGAFGPVAFLWLVLGYLQQGEELRLSTKALELQADELRQGTQALLLQADELKNSVEQQSIMAAAATQQIEAQKEALQIQLSEADNLHRARFAFSSSSRSGGGNVGTKVSTSLDVICKGADAFDVEFKFVPPIGGVGTGRFDSVHKTRASSIPLTFENAAEDITGTISLDYKGSDGRERRERYVYEIKSSDPWVKVKNQVRE